MNLEKLFRPTFVGEDPEQPCSDEARAETAAIRTYRYLRLGMIAIVAAMLTSIVLTFRNAGCFQGSISAYYYTPTGSVFVAGLVAIGLSLIVIKGSTLVEDLLLMLAGALAPIVAFVPTAVETACGTRQPLERPSAPTVEAQLNNLRALLVAGGVAVVFGAVVLIVEGRQRTVGSFRRRVALLVITGAVLLVAAWMVSTEEMLDQHGWAAVGMFAALALSSIFNGAHLVHLNRRRVAKTSPRWWALAAGYIVVGVAMVAAGIVQLTVKTSRWNHKTLVVEMIEIGLFAAMWSVQSIERWGEVVQGSPEHPVPVPVPATR